MVDDPSRVKVTCRMDIAEGGEAKTGRVPVHNLSTLRSVIAKRSGEQVMDLPS